MQVFIYYTIQPIRNTKAYKPMNTPSATFSTNHIKFNNPAIIITTFPFEFPSAKLYCIYELSASVYTLEKL